MSEVAIHTVAEEPQLVNIELEQMVLGTILCHPEAVSMVAGTLKPEYFADPVHERIYSLCLDIFERDKTCSALTVASHVSEEEAQAWASFGGRGYLARLAGASIGVPMLREQSRDLIDWWRRRELQAAARQADYTATNMSTPFDGIVDMLEEATGELRQVGQKRVTMRSIGQAMDRAFERAEAAHTSGTGITGLSTGLKDLDAMLGGLGAGDMIVIAGRPSMGKSTLALDIARHVALDSQGVFYASPEMTAEEFGYRIMTDHAFDLGEAIAYSSFRQGKYGVDEYQAMQRARNALRDIPLRIEEKAGASIPFIRAGVKRAARDFERVGTPLSMIVVDHMGLLQAPRSVSRYEMLTYFSAEMKRMAKDFEVPVLAISQLSRQVEQRDNKRPKLSDLRESGAIEQDADVVIFPYRHEYYLERDKPDFSSPAAEADWEAEFAQHKNKAEIIIDKQRNGPIGSVTVYCNMATSSFRDFGRSA